MFPFRQYCISKKYRGSGVVFLLLVVLFFVGEGGGGHTRSKT
jgi:hypothetical protein